MPRTLSSGRLLLYMVLALIAAPQAQAKSKGAEFEGALVRCQDVTEPSAPSTCGTDPLLKGKAEINSKGDVEIVVEGAAPSATYDVLYRSTDGASEEPIDALTTDGDGDGKLESKGFFGPGDIGSGNLVLQRSGNDEFVTGFHVIGGGDGDPKFEAGLVRCAEVTRPAALLNCGADPLGEGKAEIDAEDGKLEVEARKADPQKSYEVYFRSLDGAGENFIGTLTTNSGGNGKLETAAFGLNDVGSGNIVLKRDGADQFASGFKIGAKKNREQKAVLNSSLVRCIEVNEPPALSNCGADPLKKGTVTIDEKGRVKVLLVDALPNAADYQVFFRPIDGDSSGDIDTGIVIATNPSGNANQSAGVFGIGTVGSGNVVIKRGGFDQFVTGFSVTQ